MRSGGVRVVDDWTDFGAYVSARRETWLRAACLLTGDRHQAEDIVQSTLVRVWPHWARVSAKGDPDAYVRKVIFHQFASQVRRRRLSELAGGLLPGGSGNSGGRPDRDTEPDPADRVDARLQLREILAGLAPRQRAVLVLRYYLDLSEAEAAAVLGCSVGTVKSQASKALARLRPLTLGPSAALLEPTPAKETSC